MKLLSQMLSEIQRVLFPNLQEEWGPLSTKEERLIEILEVVRIDDYILEQYNGRRGRPKSFRTAMVRSFVTKAVYSMEKTTELIEMLHSSVNIRRICGFEKSIDIPSESTFSRVFAEIAQNKILEKVFEAMIKTHFDDKLVGHVSRDSTAIHAREKPIKVKKDNNMEEVHKNTKRKRGRPKKGEILIPKQITRLQRQATEMSLDEMIGDLPVACDRGTKKNSNGYKETWKGYKLHCDWSDGGVPLSCIVTSASLHDSQVAIPLTTITAGRVNSLYDLMDSAYDSDLIYNYSKKYGHIPIIDNNPRRGEKKEMDPASAIRYKERTTAERGNSALKDNFGCRTIYVKGHGKIFAHIMCGVIALAAEQLIRMLI
jgi:transposase